MKFLLQKPITLTFSLVALSLTGCHNTQDTDNVVSERYVHKYGYALTKAEWQAKDYPGQVITLLADGSTVTSTYEAGLLHGSMTATYPHSQTVEFYTLYNQGEKVKEIQYDATGTPIKEWIQLSPTRYCISMWYHEGSPMLVEEYAGEELLEGQYFSLNNEIESRVEKGAGTKFQRAREGTLLAREMVEQGYSLKKETFYSNGTPETIAFYHRNVLHGEKKCFALTGEPLSIEEWVNGELHGKATYFENGNRYLETSYLYGQKNGTERHYIDGEILSQEITWENDQKHGPTNLYINGEKETRWFYADKSISEHKFEELSLLDQKIHSSSYK